MRNQLKTILLLGALTALMLAVGSLFGKGGFVIALALSAALSFGSYFFSDRLVLASYGAKEADMRAHKRLYAIVARVAKAAQLPMPKVYIVESASPNAFATGRNPEHSAIAYTQGILGLLTEDELEGVTAHELAHVKNRDVLIATIAAAFAGAVGYLASFGMSAAGRDDEGRSALGVIAAVIVAPIAAMLVQLAVSRSREYGADETGASITRKPKALASALRRLHEKTGETPMRGAHPESAFMFIADPFGGARERIAQLLSTHPPMEDRIARLMRMRP